MSLALKKGRCVFEGQLKKMFGLWASWLQQLARILSARELLARLISSFPLPIQTRATVRNTGHPARQMHKNSDPLFNSVADK